MANLGKKLWRWVWSRLYFENLQLPKLDLDGVQTFEDKILAHKVLVHLAIAYIHENMHKDPKKVGFCLNVQIHTKPVCTSLLTLGLIQGVLKRVY